MAHKNNKKNNSEKNINNLYKTWKIKEKKYLNSREITCIKLASTKRIRKNESTYTSKITILSGSITRYSTEKGKNKCKTLTAFVILRYNNMKKEI